MIEKYGAPGESRTPDLLVRRVIRPNSKPWSALLFGNLRMGLRQEIDSYCSQVAPTSIFLDFARLGRILAQSHRKDDLLVRGLEGQILPRPLTRQKLERESEASMGE